MFSGQIGQQVYAQEMAIALPGMYIGMGPYYANPYVNLGALTQATYTITPPATVDTNTTYSLSIDGLTASFTTGGATTTVQLGQGLFNAIRANGELFRKADASFNSSSGVVTLAARFYNTLLTITSPSNSTTTNDLTIANTVGVGSATDIPYGRFVGRQSTDSVDPISGLSNAKLISSNSGFTLLGITMKSFHEKNVVGPTARSGYPVQSVMSVLEDVVGIKGIWVECVETDIVATDSVYVAVGTGNEGKASKTSSGNVDATARCKFVTAAQLDPNGKSIVGVSIKRP